MNSKILSWNDLSEFSENKRYRHKLQISWTRELIDEESSDDKNDTGKVLKS